MYGLKFLREFNFADYRLFAFHGNNLREFQLDFRLLCWEQIFWIFADFIYGTCIKQKQNAMFWFNFCLTNVGQMLKPVKRALTLSKIFMGSFTTLTYTTELIVWSIIKIEVNVNWSYIKSDVCFSWSPFQLKNQLSATKKGKVEESDEDFTPGSVRKSWVFYIVNCLRLETGQRVKLENSQRKTDFVKLREKSWNFLSSQRNSKFREFFELGIVHRDEVVLSNNIIIFSVFTGRLGRLQRKRQGQVRSGRKERLPEQSMSCLQW